MNTLTPEAIEMLADDYERGMIGPRRLRQYFDYLIQQLAAANAELAELKKQNAELFPYYQDHCEGALIPATEYQQWIKRAEQAEEQCAAMQAVIEYLSMRYRLCVQILPNGAWQVENQKRATEFAALEEKP